jgi:hypothetical protein
MVSEVNRSGPTRFVKGVPGLPLDKRKGLMRMRARILGLIGAGATALTVLAANPASATATAELNVVHGIPGVTVNVCVDGANAIPNFAPGKAVKNVSLPSGSHMFKIVPESDATCSTAGILAATAYLAAGKNYTAVASLDASGTPQLPLFTNNVSETAEGTARLTVRHTAEAPAVNVWANGTKIVGGAGFTWGKGATVCVPMGIYAAWVSLPGQFEPVIDPAVLELKAGNAYQVYAWGDATDGYALAVIRLYVGTK